MGKDQKLIVRVVVGGLNSGFFGYRLYYYFTYLRKMNNKYRDCLHGPRMVVWQGPKLVVNTSHHDCCPYIKALIYLLARNVQTDITSCQYTKRGPNTDQ